MRLDRFAWLALVAWTATGCNKDKGSGAGSASVSDEERVGESGDPAACGAPVSDVPSTSDGAVVASGQYLYWLGGTNGMPTTLARRFDTKAKRWERLPSSGTPRMKAAAGLVQGEILVAGGMTGLLKNTATVERFDIAACAWRRAGALGWKSTGPVGAAVGEALFVTGGEVYFGSSLKDFDSESVGLAALVPLRGGEPMEAEKMPTPRGDGAAVAIGEKVYVMGGRRVIKGSDSVFGPASRDVEIFDRATGKWTRGPELPGAGEGHAVAIGAHTIVFFGRDALAPRTPFVLDVAAGTWRAGKARPQELADVIEGAGVVDGVIYLVARDVDLQKPDVVLVLTYDPSADQFTTIVGGG